MNNVTVTAGNFPIYKYYWEVAASVYRSKDSLRTHVTDVGVEGPPGAAEVETARRPVHHLRKQVSRIRPLKEKESYFILSILTLPFKCTRNWWHLTMKKSVFTVNTILRWISITPASSDFLRLGKKKEWTSCRLMGCEMWNLPSSLLLSVSKRQSYLVTAQVWAGFAHSLELHNWTIPSNVVKYT
jgi:hypothetical protein